MDFLPVLVTGGGIVVNDDDDDDGGGDENNDEADDEDDDEDMIFSERNMFSPSITGRGRGGLVERNDDEEEDDGKVISVRVEIVSVAIVGVVGVLLSKDVCCWATKTL